MGDTYKKIVGARLIAPVRLPHLWGKAGGRALVVARNYKSLPYIYMAYIATRNYKSLPYGNGAFGVIRNYKSLPYGNGAFGVIRNALRCSRNSVLMGSQKETKDDDVLALIRSW